MKMIDRYKLADSRLDEMEQELKTKGFSYHHTATGCGYVSVGEIIKEKYSGKYGDGYKILRHRDGGTGNHHLVDYWIRKEK